MTQFVNVSFFCVPVHEDTTGLREDTLLIRVFIVTVDPVTGI